MVVALVSIPRRERVLSGFRNSCAGCGAVVTLANVSRASSPPRSSAGPHAGGAAQM